MLELAANVVTTLSVWLAVKNNKHTWTTGIVGCLLFAILFYQSQLYADSTLQLFFIITSVMGWIGWKKNSVNNLEVSRTSLSTVGMILMIAATVTIAYGWLLFKFTNDFMPFIDAAVLILSVIAQLLMMMRKVECWPFWIAVNSLSVGLYFTRGLPLTAVLYAAYWVNGWYGWYRWRKLCEKV